MSATDPSAPGLPIMPGAEGMENPMTTAGDVIVGGSAGAPARLAAGDNGKVLTVTAGTPAWETPATFTLPAALAADELLRSTGAGTTYEAVPQSDVVTESLEAMIGGEPAGSAVISDGAGGVRTVDPNIAPVLAATSLAGAQTALGLPWTSAAAPATVQTTDATITTLATFATTTDKGHSLLVHVTGTLSDRSAQVSWLALAAATNAAGTVTVRDTSLLGPTTPATTWVVTLSASGTNVLVRVTGALATTIDWTCSIVALVHGS